MRVFVTGIHGVNKQGHRFVMHSDLRNTTDVCVRITLPRHTRGGRYLVRDLTQKSWPERTFGGLAAVHRYEEEIIARYKESRGVLVEEPAPESVWRPASAGLPTLGRKR